MNENKVLGRGGNRKKGMRSTRLRVLLRKLYKKPFLWLLPHTTPTSSNGYTAHLPPRRTGFNPRPVHCGFSQVGIVPNEAAGRQVFSRISRFPHPINSGAAPYSLRFTLIDSQGSAVESRPNLFTHSLTHANIQYFPFCVLLPYMTFHYHGRDGAVMAERLACSPPTKENRVQSPANSLGFSQVRIVADDDTGRMRFSGISRFPCPCIPLIVPFTTHFTIIGSVICLMDMITLRQVVSCVPQRTRFACHRLRRYVTYATYLLYDACEHEQHPATLAFMNRLSAVRGVRLCPAGSAGVARLALQARVWTEHCSLLPQDSQKWLSDPEPPMGDKIAILGKRSAGCEPSMHGMVHRRCVQCDCRTHLELRVTDRRRLAVRSLHQYSWRRVSAAAVPAPPPPLSVHYRVILSHENSHRTRPPSAGMAKGFVSRNLFNHGGLHTRR
ncbi:hypothetical protein PR048_032547 [Dryococelus australis]|uniref:Uncharacterized protein n=1 Tax=Dryococelus australis TaxID=614101 RepID=A0ABQ9G6P7_9NEOP|nr:hypothetical protein PR048_032547 [Dryococelus australis]